MMNSSHAIKYADLHRSTLHPHVVKFLDHMQARGVYGQRTVKGVRSNLNDLAAEFGRRPINQFAPAFIETWMDPRKRPMSPKTRRTRLSNARVFSEWMVETGRAKAVATRQYPKVKVPKHPPVTLSVEEVGKLLDLVSGDRRATVMVLLMVSVGARCIEVSNLTVGDYDARGGMIRLVGKFGNSRDVPVPQDAARALDAYLDETGRMPGPLVRSLTNEYAGLSTATVSDYLGRWMRAAGIKHKNYDGKSAHGLRRTAASDVMDRTRDIHAVQEMLGHASIETTTQYLRKVPLDTLREAMEGRNYASTSKTPRGDRPRVKALHSGRGSLLKAVG